MLRLSAYMMALILAAATSASAYYCKISSLSLRPAPPNPVTVSGKVVSTNPTQINDGNGNLVLTGLSADVGAYIVVSGDYSGGTLSSVDLITSISQQGTEQCMLQSGGAGLYSEPNKTLKFRYRPNGSNESFVCACDNPIAVEVVDSSGTGIWIKGGYSSIVRNGGNVVCSGFLTSAAGTVFSFTDIYSPNTQQTGFKLNRTVEVTGAKTADAGYGTGFEIEALSGRALSDYDVFMPGVWYRDQSRVPATALASDLDDAEMVVREDRLPAPMVMFRSKSDSSMLTLTHVDIDGSTIPGDGAAVRVTDSRLQYGSIGVLNGAQASAVFRFPGSEGQRTYCWGGTVWQRSAPRSHPVTEGARQDYDLTIGFSQAGSYHQAVQTTWRSSYDLLNPQLVNTDPAAVKSAGLSMLSDYVFTQNSATGIPFSVNLDGTVADNSLYIGFVGAQTEAAYQLIRDGLARNDQTRINKGQSIIDFWVNSNPGNITHTWYDTNGSQWRDEWQAGKVFVRTLSDGYLGAIRAYRTLKSSGIDKTAWLAWCRRGGDWLLGMQNRDGSIFREYSIDGEVLWASGTNTCHTIPFLIELHQATGDSAYKNAAIKAGKYLARAVDSSDEYVGGTPDNPNAPDKEAALYAFRAAMYLYDATNDRAWLGLACRAATFADTFNYIWNVPIPASSWIIWPTNKSTVGASLIATGHSGSDYYNAGFAGDYMKLYRLTGDEHYKRVALILLYNTKQLVDINGSMGYGHTGMQFEAFSLGPERGTGVNVWLPWLSVVQLDGITGIEDVCGGLSNPAATTPLPGAQPASDDISSLLDPPVNDNSGWNYLDCTGRWLFETDPNNTGMQLGWYSENLNDSGWYQLTVPVVWENQGFTMVTPNQPNPGWSPYNGYAWYRLHFTVPLWWAQCSSIELTGGPLDDSDATYLNGQQIGSMGTFPAPGSLDYWSYWWATRRYTIPAGLIRFGQENVIAVRIYDGGAVGGITGAVQLRGYVAP